MPLQGETYIIFYYLSRFDDLPIFKLEKEKQLHSLTKNNSAVHLPVNRIPTCTEAVDNISNLVED